MFVCTCICRRCIQIVVPEFIQSITFSFTRCRWISPPVLYLGGTGQLIISEEHLLYTELKFNIQFCLHYVACSFFKDPNFHYL